MKKIAFAMVLCASASFSPALAQSPTITGTVASAGALVTVRMDVNTPGGRQTVELSRVTLNGTDLLGTSGYADPDLRNKLRGANCKIVGSQATCTK